MAQLIYGGVTKPLRQPFRQPYELVHIASVSDEVLRIAFEKPLLASRLVLPADVSAPNWWNDKLISWNQETLSKISVGSNNPWVCGDWSDYYCVLSFIFINAGTSVKLHPGDHYASSPTKLIGRHSWCNWAHDKALNKFGFEFYINNNKEETDPVLLYDDDESFWVVNQAGSGSYGVTLSEETTIKIKGTSSLKCVIGSGSYQYVGAKHIYGSGQDWSSHEFIGIYLYGANSGETIIVRIYDTDGDSIYWNIVDNFSGWKRFVLPINNPDTESGTFDSSIVEMFYVYSVPTSTFTFYLDRTVIDVGQWVKVEAYVPDALLNASTGIKISSWYNTSYLYFLGWNPYDYTSIDRIWGSYCCFMDGTDLDVILGSGQGWNGLGFCEVGSRGTDPNDVRCSGSFSSYYGCIQRFMFAIKMPPDDGQDSSTTGISQCKLKLEVFYADSLDPAGVQGQATYEFKNDNNQYYGLTNWLEPWMAVFDATLKKAFYFIFSERPTGLKVCADEDEQIHWIEATLPAGCRVYAGELYFDNMTRDTDADGAPDFLQTVLSDLSKGVAIW